MLWIGTVLQMQIQMMMWILLFIPLFFLLLISLESGSSHIGRTGGGGRSQHVQLESWVPEHCDISRGGGCTSVTCWNKCHIHCGYAARVCEHSGSVWCIQSSHSNFPKKKAKKALFEEKIALFEEKKALFEEKKALFVGLFIIYSGLKSSLVSVTFPWLWLKCNIFVPFSDYG